jgi:PBSX family phage portal protein
MKRQAQAATVVEKGQDKANARVLRSLVIKAVGEEESKAILEDPFENLDGVIQPPFPLLVLSMLKENSTELRQCIDAMSTNIDSFGYRLLERKGTKPDDPKLLEEKSNIRAFLDNINFEDDITSLRRETRNEIEETGNAYWELIPYANKAGISSIERLNAHTVRLVTLDDLSTKVKVKFYNEFTGAFEEKIVRKKFRRFVQIVTTKKVYFKEWGDPRNISSMDGSVIPDNELDKRSDELANPVYHFKIKSNRSAYGIPRHIGNLFSIYGSRAAEEINFVTFQNNNIPSMIVMVSNGQLTDSSIKRIEEFVETKIKGEGNRSSFLIIEAEPADEAQLNPGTMKMDIKDLTNAQKDDQLFQNYDKNNSEKIRRCWRLPPIFVGKSDDYNRATAQESRKLADEQVFSPERREFDRIMNKILMTEFSMQYHSFVSNSANVTNDEDLVKILSNSEKTGGVTPNLARQILSDILNRELPEYGSDVGFDPDIPMSMTLVQMSQNVGGNSQTGVIAPNQGQLSPGSVPANATADEVAKNLLTTIRKALYKDIYNEILYEI